MIDCGVPSMIAISVRRFGGRCRGMSGPYQVAYDRVLPPRPFQVADPFHVVRLANRCVDLVRRRVQNETLGAPRTET